MNPILESIGAAAVRISQLEAQLAIRDELVSENKRKVKRLESEIIRLRSALMEIKAFNPLRNDLDAYLLEAAEFALGQAEEKPSRADYGIE